MIKTPVEDAAKAYKTMVSIKAFPDDSKIEEDSFMFTMENSFVQGSPIQIR